MKKILLIFIFTFYVYAYAAAQEVQEKQSQPVVPGQQEQVLTGRDLPTSSNVTLDFKEADINNVLKIISYKSYPYLSAKCYKRP